MDWGRAKTVLIWAFLFLNILLGYQLWMDELNLNTFTENASRRDEMNRLLGLKDIRLDAAVPEGTPVLSEITVSVDGAGMPESPEPLNAPLTQEALGDVQRVREALAAAVPNVGEYEPDPFAAKAGGAVYVMNQLYDELPMFEMRLELYGAEDGTVTGYRYLSAQRETPVNVRPPQGQEVLSAYVVVGTLAETYLPQGAVIADVRLGYHGPMFESETQVLAPYWRIVLRTGETYYVHAINGAVEGPSVAQAADGAQPLPAK
ncbi:two-component system regulatory protein YycI [Paenibacillus sp.]|uniref:two-component system regulatory protein YycI n=1 Tax=Paenibacillus sp. TaxID=58172 RepID=UPI002D360429|nr:two-component system regulatory protein YycI [Paenibacillus sp.]HZG84871.1 two-component system regulatory protein YycI [Paenibacillus sp.]